MGDVDRMVRSSLREHAESTPAPVDLLGAVHRRSRRLARRRRMTFASAAAAAVLVVSTAVAGLPAWWGDRSDPPAAPGPVVPSIYASPAPTAPTPSPVGSPSADPSGTGADRSPRGKSQSSAPSGSLKLAAPAYAAPTYGWRPGITPVGGLDDPELTMDRGWIVAYYAARDPVRGADVTIRVGSQRPTFPGTAAGPVTESARQARGRPATLRTVHVAPAAQLSLYWREASGRWVRVDTDDTLTDAEVVRFADELEQVSRPVPVPFVLKLAPVGMVLDTVSSSTMTFRPAGGGSDAVVSCVLTDGARRLKGDTTTVGGYPADITRTGSAAVLAVSMDDRGETLTVVVSNRYPVSDAELIRFAAGITITDYADPES